MDSCISFSNPKVPHPLGSRLGRTHFLSLTRTTGQVMDSDEFTISKSTEVMQQACTQASKTTNNMELWVNGWMLFLRARGIIYIWVFPKIRVPPKSSILTGLSISNHLFLGYPYFWKHPFICIQPWKSKSTIEKMDVHQVDDFFQQGI